jgi:uncharacterized membrane protein YhaH (DUF805 family)
MKNIKKYFEFSGTINGTNYVLRNLLATLVGFIGGFTVGMGVVASMPSLTFLGGLFMIPAFWFNTCTIYKRSEALFPEYALVITIGMFLLHVLQILGEMNPLFFIPPLIIGLILIFKNSNIEEHNG